MLLRDIIRHLKTPIVTNGLVCWFDGKDFRNNPATATLRDRSGNNNNATPSGFAFTNSSGADGNGGIVLDGIDDNLIKTNMPIINNNPITICLLAKIISNPTSTVVPIVYGNTGNPSQTLGLKVANTSLIGVSIWGSDYDTAFVKDLNWHYWTLVYNGSTVLAYMDGVPDANGAKPRTLNFAASPTLGIGLLPNYAGFNANCNIKSVQIYNKALTNAEILQNYNALR